MGRVLPLWLEGRYRPQPDGHRCSLIGYSALNSIVRRRGFRHSLHLHSKAEDSTPTYASSLVSCVRNIFDLSGTNVVAVHWNLQLTNREGMVGQNSGVTVVNIKRGKVFLVKDFIFDLGDNFRRNWSSP